MNIGIASDHRGYKLKEKLTKYLMKKHYNVINYGTDSIESVDYPDYAIKIGDGINKKEIDLGIIICGTGIGVSIVCNKIKGIRCAKVNNIKEAKMARAHNDANVLAIGSDLWLITAKDIVDAFINTPFSNEERHINRIAKITKIEEGNL
ncbi:MAG: ribose 5-phosphate isomerase B [Bacilli bacterium]|jgi:ribose 5-phosphate isomerase B